MSDIQIHNYNSTFGTDNHFELRRSGNTTKTAGAGSAATTGGAQTSSLAKHFKNSNFNFDIYLSANEVQPGDEARLTRGLEMLSETIDQLQAQAELYDSIDAFMDKVSQVMAEKTLSDAEKYDNVLSLSIAISEKVNNSGVDIANFPKRVKDLLALLTEVTNLERGAAIEMIKNRVLGAVSELKAAAQKTRDAATKLMWGAITQLIVTGVSLVASGFFTLKASKQNLAAGEKVEELKGVSRDFKKNLEKTKTATDVDQEALKLERGGFKGESNRLKAETDILHQTSVKLSGYGRSIDQGGQALGRFGEGLLNSFAKKDEADGQEKQANAQAENASKEVMVQYLNQLKSMVEALLQSYREVRDTQDQVKANIAKNA
ncbi:hypothetical protein [Pseudochelatococcus sp. G4_1912]|uniref:hypothetical protein n=1 Tax=Pseudochelatococcus sp. G4_1912 TaxID=3114288 RepID=UPI0039C6F293